MDFLSDIKNFENQLLDEFHHYKIQNQRRQDNLNLQHREMNSYFDDLSSNLSKAVNDINEDGLRTQGLSSINNSREMLQNHISHQINRLNREFEETRDEFRQRARNLH